MFKLHELTQLVKKRKRIARGGDRGGTSGRGHKGQKARSGGNVKPSFEGGQMPLHRRLPKRGFSNIRFAKEVLIVDLKRVTDAFDEGAEVTRSSLIEKKLIKPKKGKSVYLVKVLGNEASKKLVIEADAFSKSAMKALTDVGGQARLTKEN